MCSGHQGISITSWLHGFRFRFRMILVESVENSFLGFRVGSSKREVDATPKAKATEAAMTSRGSVGGMMSISLFPGARASAVKFWIFRQVPAIVVTFRWNSESDIRGGGSVAARYKLGEVYQLSKKG